MLYNRHIDSYGVGWHSVCFFLLVLCFFFLSFHFCCIRKSILLFHRDGGDWYKYTRNDDRYARYKLKTYDTHTDWASWSVWEGEGSAIRNIRDVIFFSRKRRRRRHFSFARFLSLFSNRHSFCYRFSSNSHHSWGFENFQEFRDENCRPKNTFEGRRILGIVDQAGKVISGRGGGDLSNSSRKDGCLFFFVFKWKIKKKRRVAKCEPIKRHLKGSRGNSEKDRRVMGGRHFHPSCSKLLSPSFHKWRPFVLL